MLDELRVVEFSVGHLIQQRTVREESHIPVVMNNDHASLGFLECWFTAVSVLLTKTVVAIKVHPGGFDVHIFEVSEGLIIIFGYSVVEWPRLPDEIAEIRINHISDIG